MEDVLLYILMDNKYRLNIHYLKCLDFLFLEYLHIYLGDGTQVENKIQGVEGRRGAVGTI